MIVLDGNAIFFNSVLTSSCRDVHRFLEKEFVFEKVRLVRPKCLQKKLRKVEAYSLELGAVQGIVSRNRKEPKFTSDDKLRMT